MDVIFDAVYYDGFAVSFIDQVADDAEKFGSPFFFDYRLAIFYRENCLDINLVIGIGHLCIKVVRLSWFELTILICFIQLNGLRSFVTIWGEATPLIASL